MTRSTHPDALPHPVTAAAAPAGCRRRAWLQQLGLLAVPALTPWLAACGGGGDDAEDRAAQREVDRAARAAVAAGLVGAAVGHVTRRPAVRTSTAVAGLRRYGTTAAVQRSDAFSIGSNSKAMTSAVIAAAVDAGALRWSQRIVEIMPSLRRRIRADYAAVTLADLLDHRAGVLAFDGRSDDETRFFSALQSAPGPLPTQLAGRRRWFTDWVLRQAPPAGVQPRRDFHYSNAGYAIAATLLEAATGRSFEAQAAALLVERLGVEGRWRTVLDVPVSLPPPAPECHEAPRDALRWTAPSELYQVAGPWLQVLVPDGGWAGSAAAYARWLQWHLQALAGGTTPLPASYVERLRGLNGDGYALGWVGLELAGRPVLFHTGHEYGFMAETVVDAAGTQAVFGCTNTGWEAEDGSSWVMAALDGVLSPLWRSGAAA